MSYCTPFATLVPKQECFFQLPGQNLSNDIDVQLVFKNNSADIAGSVLYGGAIDNCKLTHGLESHNSGKVFDTIVHNNDSNDNTISNISSDPLQICNCELDYPNCSYPYPWYSSPYTVYPGETFHVSVGAVGQRGGTVPSKVISTIDDTVYPGTTLQNSEYLQQLANNACTKLNYTVFSLSQSVTIRLQAEGTPCSNYDFFGDTFTLLIVVDLNRTCPPGRNISESKNPVSVNKDLHNINLNAL